MAVRTLALILLLIMLPALGATQSAGDYVSPPGINVVKVSWRFRVNQRQSSNANNVWSERNSGAQQPQISQSSNPRQTNSGQLSLPETVTVTETTRSEAVITLKNEGTKVVSKISYTFLFINRETGKTLLSYKFKDNVAIEPDETKTFTRQVGDKRADQFGPGGRLAWQRVECKLQITRVEYADDSVWRSK